ncbi:MAG: ABC transporter permease [Candidatus Oleimicrobiaceae bacterium]
MDVRESIKMSVSAIGANKFRSILTALGIIIGVFAVIGMQTIIQGLNNWWEKELSVLGADTFQIRKYPAVQLGDSWLKYRNRRNITLEEVAELQRRATLVRVVSPEVFRFGATLRYRDRKTNPDIIVLGGDQFRQEADGQFVSEGRFINETDVQRRRQVCVIGTDLAEQLFPYRDAVGEEILIDGHRCTVIGVLEEKGSIFGQSQDAHVILPISTFGKFYGMNRSVYVDCKAVRPELLNQAIEEVTGIMRAVRRVPPGEPNDFEIVTRDSLMETWRNVTKVVFVAALVICGISLLVGGIGVMNIMLVSVTERTREIGIRKAVGARRRDILGQFLLEAVLMCEFGGIIGAVLGVGTGLLIGALTPLPAAVPVWAVLVGLGFISLVGIVFGIYPAARAARLDPIEALRYE